MIQEIPFHRLQPSPLNPRKTKPSPEAIAALAASIEAEGLLENLVLRPSPRDADFFEIVAGETRARAFQLLVEQGKRAAGDTLPARVLQDCSDRDVVELGLIENLQRSDLHPLDEAEGYAALRDGGLTTEEIAARLPFTLRHVQLRLQLADNLTAEAKKAFRAGIMPLASARILAATCPQQRQAAVIERIEEGDWEYSTPDELRDTLRCDAIVMKHALFPRERYTGAVQIDVPELDEDRLDVQPGGKDVELAGDVELFWKLQNEAVEARRLELAAIWADCRVVRESFWSPYRDGLETGSKDKKIAIAVLHVAPDGKVTEYKGLLSRRAAEAREKAKAAGTTAKGKNAAEIAAETGENTLPSKYGQVQAKHAKTRALRAAMLYGPDGVKAAQIAVIIGLMGEHGAVRLGYRLEHSGVDNAIGAPEVEKVLDEYRARLQACVSKDSYAVPGGPGQLDVKGGKAAALYRELAAWTAADVEDLLTALVAASIGTWPDHDPRLGDDPVAVAMADHLQPDVAAVWQLDEAYARTLKKAGLLRALDDMGIDTAAEASAGKKVSELVDSVVHVAKHVSTPYLPPLFHFGSEADVRKRIKPGAAVTPAAPAPGKAPKAKAKKVAKKKTAKPAAKGSRRAAMTKKVEEVKES